ncbi:TPA: PTS mannose/fructose/sorbose/N-acetylgalactosamine transporter subunit IIC [Streptococcus suis]
MMQWWQILLLTLYSAYQICDELTIVSSAGSPIFAGFITGLVMGDMETGLAIGASLQLMVLGVGTFGGASRIDATSGAVLATAFSVSQGLDPEIAIATIGVPVAGLLVYTDILGRFTTTFFAHRVDAAIEKFDYAGIERNYLLGAIPWALSRALPVFLALQFGGGLVETLVTTIELPEYKWIAAGLTLAARMLPGLGFAILLHYLPLKRNLHYLAVGFALTAMLTVLYGNVSTLGLAVSQIGGLESLAEGLAKAEYSFVNNFKGLSMIGIAIVGAFLSVLHFKNSQKVTVVAPSNSESGEIEDDEI